MTLIVLVIAFAIELLSDHMQRWRGDQWFEDFARGLVPRFRQDSVANGPIGVALVLALPLIVIAVIQALLEGGWLGLLGLLFAVLVLVYSLRYQPLEQALDRCCDALEAGDRTAARNAAVSIGLAPEQGEDPGRLGTTVMVQSHHRLFGVVFWFAVLGAVGAAFYRLTWLLAHPRTGLQQTEPDPFRLSARHLLAILDWVPIRLLAISYALAGSFDDALQEWRSAPAERDDLFDSNYELLHNVAVGALRPDRYEIGDEELLRVPGRVDATVVRSARAVVMRSAMLWGIVVALFTLGGMAY